MNVSLTQFGEHAILISWPSAIAARTHQEVMALNTLINATFPEIVIETVPSYHSIAVFLKPSENPINFINTVKRVVTNVSIKQETKSTLVSIPVCYEDDFALDINRVSEINNLSVAEVIALHSSTVYPLYFLGFLPGFPYLAGLDEKLRTSRLATPRLHIAAGSVGIGGSQTGIYPSASPGGWNIIGRTPVQLFNVDQDPPNLLKAGDHIQFEVITRLDYDQIKEEIINGSYQLKTTVL